MGWFFIGFLLYFLIVLAERALAAFSPQEADALRHDAATDAKRVVAMMDDLKPTFGALVLARVFAKIVISIFAAVWLARSLAEASFSGVPRSWWIMPVSYTILISVLAVVFWGVKQLPKPRRAVEILRRLAGFVFVLKKVFSLFLKKEKKAVQQPDNATAVSNNMETAAQASEKQEMEMLRSIVKFSDVTVKQVMQPRPKVVAVDFRTNFAELLEVVRESEFSRIPVYDEDLDNVTGILYVKDLVPHLERAVDFEWQPLIRTDFLLAPESKRISELLAEFKKKRQHMAIVVDEYGGSAGIVTMEDILEEVTGDIRDEFDTESEVRFTKLDEYNYLFEGRTLLSDVCRTVGVDPQTFDAVRDGADTLAGLMLELSGDIPKKGTEIRWEEFLMTVIMSDNRRIGQIKLTLPRS